MFRAHISVTALALLSLASAVTAQSRFSAPGLVWSAAAGGGPVAVAATGEVYLAEAVPDARVCGATLTDPLFVTRLDTSGRTVLARTFIGCGRAAGIALTPSGEVFVVGDTDPSVFTPTSSFVQRGASRSAFVVKVDASGTRVYAVDVGGLYAFATGVAVDAQGHAFVAGGAGDRAFPLTPNAFDHTFHGGGTDNVPTDAVFFELDPDGTSLLYSTYFGGTGDDQAAGIALDSSGSVIVAGSTVSSDLPVTAGARQPTNPGGRSGFVAKFNPSGSALVWSTYLGGSGYDLLTGLAVRNGDIYVAGTTSSSDFPTTSDAAQPTHTGYMAAGFVARLTASGSLRFGTYLSGTEPTVGTTMSKVAAGPDGDAYVIGYTETASYPVTPGALQTRAQGSADVVVTRLTDAGALRYSTRLGSPDSEWGDDIAVGPTGDVYVTGGATPQFPFSADTVRTVPNEPNVGAFVARIVARPARTAIASATSQESAALDAQNAIDGDPATRWSSSFIDPQTLILDLREQIAVDRIVLVWERAAAASYDLMVSDDLDSWRTVASVSDGIGGVADFPGVAGVGRYVAMHASTRSTGWGDSLWEMLVFGEPAYPANLPPVVTMTSPLEGAHFAAGEAVEISVEATDPEMQAVVVTVFVDGNRAATLNGGPHYELKTMLSTGSHVIQVDATDALNAASPRVSAHISVSPDIDAGVNLAYRHRVTSSSTEGPGLEAINAVDGSFTTRWSSRFSDPQWIAVDLGARFDLRSIVLRWETAYARAFDIQVSNDGEQWSTVRAVTDGSGGTQTFTTLASTARFVRIFGRERATPWGYSLWELQVFGTPVPPGPDNLALGRPTTASSSENGALTAARATDGDPTTRWSSAFEDDQWLAVDLGSMYDVSRVVVRWEAAFASRYFVEVSYDGENWRAVADRRGSPNATDESLLSDAIGRYVRVHGIERGTSWGISIFELEVYGTPTSLPNNVALHASVSVSGVESSLYEPELVVDGDESTRWSSRFSDGEWLTLDLGTVFKLTQIRLHWEAAYALEYRVDVSTRAAEGWHTVFSTSTGNGGIDELSVATEARYISIVFEKRATPWGFSLYEVQAFGVPVVVTTNPSWQILTLIYDRTEFTYTDVSGRTRSVVGMIDPVQYAAAVDAATQFAETDIPALTSRQMVPHLTIRNGGTLTNLSPHSFGWWPSPWDVNRDPAFDAVIVIWQPNVVDQATGEALWIGSAAGLTPAMGTGQTYTTLIADAATTYGHRNVFKHEFGHSITEYFDAAGTAPKPKVENHTDVTTYVHCVTGTSYAWVDETLASPIPNSIYNNDSGFTHDYYSGTTALRSDPNRCLGIPNDAWAHGGPVTRP